jgi:hypothetical protein
MPNSVNGVGTRYIGQRDFRLDGSYVTTNFFCLFFLPIFPVHSVRVIADPKNLSLPFHTNYYTIMERHRPHLGQVLSVYACTAAVVGITILYFDCIVPYLEEHIPAFSQGWSIVLALVSVLLLPLLFAKWRLCNARQRVRSANR